MVHLAVIIISVAGIALKLCIIYIYNVIYSRRTYGENLPSAAAIWFNQQNVSLSVSKCTFGVGGIQVYTYLLDVQSEIS